MDVEKAIRGVELFFTAISTYLSALLLVKSGLYQGIRGHLLTLLSPLALPIDTYLDMLIISIAVVLSLHLWRRGSESSYGRLFSLNLLMFFPAILDYSLFNWVELILPYDPNLGMSLLTFIVGIFIQLTYLTIRSTLLIRYTRDELLGRGAEPEDVDSISKGQVAYLFLILMTSTLILFTIYLALPHLEALLRAEVLRVPYTPILIGFSATLLIAIATLLFLKSWRR